MNDRTFTLAELCAISAISKRTIRYYMQLDLIPRPQGGTKGAYYTSDHLARLLQLKQWVEAGVSLERIRDILAGEAAPVPLRRRRPGSVEVRSHIFISPGIELSLSPEEAGWTPEQVRAFVKEAAEMAERVATSENGGETDPNDKET
ncbi:MAG: MerR family transcriptional regulator [Planctomycetota bacterium]|nr:MerR family transcriptional regulator [Planctomycetota bacterium]